MAMENPHSMQCQPHDEAEELLPWYAAGQLDPTDRQRLEAHLSTCAHCRQQLSLERRLVQEFRAAVPEVESGWARLRARIETPVRLPQRRAPGLLEQLLQFLRRPAVASLAAAQLAFVVIAGSLLVSLSRPEYHALGSSPVPESANIVVMFRPDARMHDIDEILRSQSASIVEGPTDARVYLVHVPAEKRQIALLRLQSNAEVQLAQPIDGLRQ